MLIIKVRRFIAGKKRLHLAVPVLIDSRFHRLMGRTDRSTKEGEKSDCLQCGQSDFHVNWEVNRYVG